MRADLDALPVTGSAPLKDCGGRAERAVHRRTVMSQVAREACRWQMRKSRCVESARRGEGGESLESLRDANAVDGAVGGVVEHGDGRTDAHEAEALRHSDHEERRGVVHHHG